MKTTVKRRIPVVGSVFVGLAWSALVLPPVATGQPTEATFTRDIAPILQRSCENCHRTGGVAPFPLTTHDEVRPWARAIKNRTLTREMPPWFIEKNVGIQRFKNDISLSDEEIGLIGAWVDNGAPLGDPADMPSPLAWNDLNEWAIGEPDLIVSSPVTLVEAEAPDLNIWLAPSQTGLTEDRYIKAVEFKETRLEEPTAARTPGTDHKADLTLWMVHHAITGTQMPDGTDVGGGVTGSRGGGNFGHAHELGQNATFYPDGLGVRLRGDSSLTWQVHFHSIGKETPVRLDAGFKLHPKGYVPTHSLGGPGPGGLSFFDMLDIPAGETKIMEAFTVTSEFVKMITFEPHMHAGSTRMCMNALYPSGVRETLNCSGYNHNWVKVYSYEDDAAPLMPPGTIIQVIGWYDNTASNPRNAEPRNWKGLGHRSIDDMLFFLGKFVNLSEEEYVAELDARGDQTQRGGTSTSQNNN